MQLLLPVPGKQRGLEQEMADRRWLGDSQSFVLNSVFCLSF